eukprot:3554934-Amphidinium_carterae.2
MDEGRSGPTCDKRTSGSRNSARPFLRRGFPLPQLVPGLHFELSHFRRAGCPAAIKRDREVPDHGFAPKPLVDLARRIAPGLLDIVLPSFAVSCCATAVGGKLSIQLGHACARTACPVLVVRNNPAS